MREHFEKIYANHAAAYDTLVRREDHEGNLLRAIEARVPLEGADVVELGAGTGRLTCLLADRVGSLRAFDREPAMLEVARRRLGEGRRWRLDVADHRKVPLEDEVADLVIEGWAFGHLVEDAPEPWLSPAEEAILEMRRVVRAGGTMMMIETLGTGRTEPLAPSERLAGLYRHLEGALGFSHAWIRTDYAFDSLQEAEELARFFFGEELARRIRAEGLRVLPECTGLWWKRKSAS